MNTEMIVTLTIIIVLLILSAFFSSSETALFSLDSLKIKKMRKSKGIKRIKQLLQDSSVVLIVILLGNSTVNVALSSLTEKVLPFENEIFSIIIATGVLLYFGEITPKTIAISRVESTSLFNSRFLYPFYKISRPIAYPITIFSNWILKGLNKISDTTNESKNERNQLEALASIVSRGGFLDKDEKKLVERVIKFAGQEVWNIMTPRNKVISMKQTMLIKEAIPIFKNSRYSKIPVFSNTDDNIVGVIYLRSIFSYLHHARHKLDDMTVEKIMENMYYVPHTKKLSEMLEDFQTKNIGMATVVDEYGSSIGIVTISDVLGEIVGEIVDEKFIIQKKIIRISHEKYIVPGDIDIDDFNQYFDTSLSSEEFETLAGYFIEQIGDIPDVGYSTEVEKYSISIRQRTANHIEKFLVEKK